MGIKAAAEVWLDKLVYDDQDQVHAFVRMLGREAPPEPVIVFVAPKSSEVEAVKLRPSNIAGVLETIDPLPVSLSPLGTARPMDGTLSLLPGELFVALFSAIQPEELQRSAANGPDGSLVCAVGLMRDTVSQDALVRIVPEITMTDDETQPPPGGKRLGTLAAEGGLPVQLPIDELIFLPRDREQLDDFLRLSGTEIVAETRYPSARPPAPPAERNQTETTAYLLRADLQRAPKQALPQLRELFGEQHVLLASNEAVLDLYALVLQYRAQGFAVGINPRLHFMSIQTRDGTSEVPINAMGPTAPAGLSDPLFGVQRAWAFMALWDADRRIIPAAFLDMGFAPNWDFRGYPDAIPQRDLENGTSGPGSAVGVPRVGNSFFGSRSWHGNGVVTTAAGVLNNGWGSVGTGGQVAKPMLYEMGLHSYAFEMGVGIQLAVNDGATVINISAGYPCRIVADIGLGFRVCGPGERAVFCTAVTAALFAAAGLTALIPIVGPILAGPMLAAASAISVACYATVLLGDPRSPMEAAVQYALEHGVTIVSIAGNQQTEATLGLLCRVIACGAQDVSAWEIVPGVIPGVICVGAADATAPYANNQYFGDRVDVWAPIGGTFFRPSTTDAVTGPDEHQRQDGFNGTSAAAPYVAGIIAMMQAVNTSLDPRTAGLSSEARRGIPARIASILRTTATPASSLPTTPASDDVTRRQRLVNAYAAVREAARGVVPDFEMLGYDVSVGLDERVTSDSKTTAKDASATDSATYRGTILYLPDGGLPGGSRYADEDWYAYVTPDGSTDVFTGGRMVLRQLGSPSSLLILEADRGKLRRISELVSPDGLEQIVEYEAPPLFAGVRFIIAVRGVLGSDGLYKITFLPATPVPGPIPDRFDRPSDNPPERPNNDIPERAVPLGTDELLPWVVVSAPMELGHSWEVRIPDLNLHVRTDQDWFVLTMPADVSMWASLCPPSLTVSLEPDDLGEGAEVVIVDKDGVTLAQGLAAAAVDLSADVQARFPLRFVVRSTGIGPVEYTLVVSVSEINDILCKYMHEPLVPVRHFPHFGRIKIMPKGADDPFVPVDPLDDPVPFDRRRVQRVTDGERLLLGWRGGSGFRIDVVTSSDASLHAVLEDLEGNVLAQGTPTAAMEGAHAPQWFALAAANLRAGPYFVRFVGVQEAVDAIVSVARAPTNNPELQPMRSIRDIVEGRTGTLGTPGTNVEPG